MKPNPKEINIILNILKGAQFEFLPRASFYIDTPLFQWNLLINSVVNLDRFSAFLWLLIRAKI
jgi:hypothetical protein